MQEFIDPKIIAQLTIKVFWVRNEYILLLIYKKTYYWFLSKEVLLILFRLPFTICDLTWNRYKKINNFQYLNKKVTNYFGTKRKYIYSSYIFC